MTTPRESEPRGARATLEARESVAVLERRLAEAEAEIVRLRALLAAGSAPADDVADQPAASLLAAVVNASGDAIVGTDQSQRITTWNPGAERLFGFAAAEAIGQVFSSLVPADRPDLRRDAVVDAARQGKRDGFEARRRRKDGSFVDVETVVSPIHDAAGVVIGVSSISRDITSRKAIEAKVLDLEARFRTFFEQMPGLTYIYSAQAEGPYQGVLHRSQQFETLTGYPQELWQRDRGFFFTIVHPDDQARVAAQDQRTNVTGDPFLAEYRIVTRSGQVIWVREHATLVHGEDGEPLYWLGFMIDISERKQAEAATAEAVAKLQASNLALQELSNAKSEFVSLISHEFRTPLTSIQGFSELIVTEAESLAEARGFAETINEAAVRLSRLVGNVLDLDQMEAGQTTLQLTNLDLNQLVASVLEAAGPTSRHQLVPRLDPGLPLIRGDADGIVRMVTNLVANAIKYSPSGGTIIVTTTRRGDKVELSVADQGLGVPEKHRATIFSRYGRIHRPEQLGIEGTGLGLPIVRYLVDLHGGDVWVTDNQPEGAIFHVVLPIAGPRGD